MGEEPSGLWSRVLRRAWEVLEALVVVVVAAAIPIAIVLDRSDVALVPLAYLIFKIIERAIERNSAPR